MSKAWGLAGARLGMLLAPKCIVDVMNKVRAPFNINSLTEAAATQALANSDTMANNVRAILAERDRVAEVLRGLTPAVCEVFPSDANFLLIRVDQAKTVCDVIARDANVVIRYRGSMLNCKDCIRVTIGTRDENNLFLVAFQKATGSVF